MAKSYNQKAKILLIERMLRDSGENHVVPMQDILSELAKYDITAERKSIYDDMEALRSVGVDVRFKRGRPGGYYIPSASSDEPGDQSALQDALDIDAENTDVRNIDSIEASALLRHETDNANTMPEDNSRQNPGSFCVLEFAPERGSQKQMKLLCESSRMKDARKFFGDSAEYVSRYPEGIQISAGNSTDEAFFAWLTLMGKSVKIIKPRKTAVAYREYLKELAKDYKGL